ncbi:MAG TPA: hypothetical protein VNN25_09095 [Thermoanaerobaculia bacterium]|nr:hypothetical protein [Thermoanaerobaculia bacterium]
MHFHEKVRERAHVRRIENAVDDEVRPAECDVNRRGALCVLQALAQISDNAQLVGYSVILRVHRAPQTEVHREPHRFRRIIQVTLDMGRHGEDEIQNMSVRVLRIRESQHRAEIMNLEASEEVRMTKSVNDLVEVDVRRFLLFRTGGCVMLDCRSKAGYFSAELPERQNDVCTRDSGVGKSDLLSRRCLHAGPPLTSVFGFLDPPRWKGLL